MFARAQRGLPARFCFPASVLFVGPGQVLKSGVPIRLEMMCLTTQEAYKQVGLRLFDMRFICWSRAETVRVLWLQKFLAMLNV